MSSIALHKKAAVIYVNPAHVQYFQATRSGTAIHFGAGHKIEVDESVEKVSSAISAAHRK
jgi:uncharacterized protein YlzI (FlbEa/FlbD family)